jgi:hypothetical protein
VFFYFKYTLYLVTYLTFNYKAYFRTNKLLIDEYLSITLFILAIIIRLTFSSMARSGIATTVSDVNHIESFLLTKALLFNNTFANCLIQRHVKKMTTGVRQTLCHRHCFNYYDKYVTRKWENVDIFLYVIYTRKFWYSRLKSNSFLYFKNLEIFFTSLWKLGKQAKKG